MIVQKANVQLNVAEEIANTYYVQGYDIYDDDFNLVKKAVPNNLVELQALYVQQIKQIEELKAEINKLKNQSTKKSVKKSSEKVD